MNFKPVMANLILLATAIVSLQAQDRTKSSGFQASPLQPQKQAAVSPIQSPIQGMTNTPVQAMTNSPIQGMISSPVTGMGGGVLSQKSSTTIGQPLDRKTIAPNFILSSGETTFVSDGATLIGNDPNQDLGASLPTPGLPMVSLNPETPAESPDPGGSIGDGTSIEQTVRTTNTNIANLEPGTPQEKVIEKFGSPVAYTMNSDGQTLFFKGGGVVLIKNGVVATPGK